MTSTTNGTVLTDEQITACLVNLEMGPPVRLPPGWKAFARSIEREVLAALAAQQPQAAEQRDEAVAFVHWPLDSPPRLVWNSRKAFNDAILKSHEGHQNDLLLYTAAPAVPEGWALVPLEPTPKMLDALCTGSRKDWPSDELCRVRYAAVLAAAPKQGHAEPTGKESP